MNEAFFSKGRFAKARPVGRPDFEVLLTMTCLRQVNTPTARRAMAIPVESGCSGDPISILANSPAADATDCTSFYDLSAMDWVHGERPANHEDAVNLGISGYFQSPPLNAVIGQHMNTGFEDL